MKKIITLILFCAVACALAACSQSQQPSPEGTSSTPPTASDVSPEATDCENATSASVQTVYGKITQVVGNNISLSLGNLPQDGLVKGNEDTVEQTITMEDAIARGLDVEENSANDLPAGSQIFMVAPSDGESDGTGDQAASSAPQMELEYTGEVLDYTIPAGISILNIFGEEVTMNELTKGTIVMLMVDTSTQAVTGIQVLGK